MKLMERPIRAKSEWKSGDGNRNKYWIEGVSINGKEVNPKDTSYKVLEEKLSRADYFKVHTQTYINSQHTEVVWAHKKYNMVCVMTKDFNTKIVRAHHINRAREGRFLPESKLAIYGSKK